jgi:sugar phosphate permease
VPLFLKDRAGLPEITVGATFNLLLLEALAGPLLGGWLSDRMEQLPLHWAVYGLSVPLLVCFGLLAGFPLWTTGALALIAGLVADVEDPLLPALVSDAVPTPVPSAVFRFFFAMACGVGSLWLVLLGWAIQHLGFSAAFGIIAGSYLGAALLLMPCRQPGPAPSHA